MTPPTEASDRLAIVVMILIPAFVVVMVVVGLVFGDLGDDTDSTTRTTIMCVDGDRWTC